MWYAVGMFVAMFVSFWAGWLFCAVFSSNTIAEERELMARYDRQNRDGKVLQGKW